MISGRRWGLVHQRHFLFFGEVDGLLNLIQENGIIPISVSGVAVALTTRDSEISGSSPQ